MSISDASQAYKFLRLGAQGSNQTDPKSRGLCPVHAHQLKLGEAMPDEPRPTEGSNNKEESEA